MRCFIHINILFDDQFIDDLLITVLKQSNAYTYILWFIFYINNIIIFKKVITKVFSIQTVQE